MPSVSRSRSRSVSPTSRRGRSPVSRGRQYSRSRSRSLSNSRRDRYDSRDRGRSYRRRDSPDYSSYRRNRSRSIDRKRDRRQSPPRRNGRHYRDNDPLQQRMTEIQGIRIRPEESFSEFRTRVRNELKTTIWAPSPQRPRSLSPDGSKRSSKSKKQKRRHDTTRHKKHRHHSSREKKRRRHSSSESDTDSVSSIESVGKTEKEEKPVLEVDKSHLDQVQDLWVEKEVDLPDDLAPVGPVPMAENDNPNERSYGGALLPGEGSAMAAYVQQGKRIPRRGEIGLSGDQIADFERAGYVMSGSRHQRMNAVRLRKENQVISAEEKRMVLQHAQEQKIKRENEIISGFREILNEKFKKDE
ncbi:ras-induced vulval development antagonist-domain-containing protein [Mycotypha africana]|uniref:ras-induced vulval development antagonist-domain-containing protein n=1 Tax=Mycotypha africana TaxID=64632 RepID=UPI002300D6BB|nr:ras-induced vulval development antagonist-domain-containing protein [Mycotypha africana]KAI8990826.1 ras-induced vulval development antagonist-domain-containing protein [Mycotypha africana]